MGATDGASVVRWSHRHTLCLSRMLLLVACVFICSADLRSADADGATEASATFDKRVGRAIDLGKAWLIRAQARNGSFAGPSMIEVMKAGASGSLENSALGAYALAACGEPASSASMAKALQYIRRSYPTLLNSSGTSSYASYALSLILLTIHEVYCPKRTTSSSRDQRKKERRSSSKGSCRPPRWARRASGDIAAWLLRCRSSRGLFRYPGSRSQLPPSDSLDEDISNTQFVLMGLWCASRMGHDFGRKDLESILERLLGWQETTGPSVKQEPLGETQAPAPTLRRTDRPRGFSYTPPVEGIDVTETGSTSAAGVVSLGAVKGMLRESGGMKPERVAILDQAIRDGLAWLSQNYTIARNPQASSQVWHHYYLFGLARALRLLAVKKLAGRDWYREGAEHLIKWQRPNGSWPACETSGIQRRRWSEQETHEFWDTCFALLFLCESGPTPRKPLLDGNVITPADR